MNTQAILHAKEKIAELNARRYFYSTEEFRLAQRIQFAIREQQRIEEEIMAWSVELESLSDEESVKSNDSKWSLKKVLGGLL